MAAMGHDALARYEDVGHSRRGRPKDDSRQQRLVVGSEDRRVREVDDHEVGRLTWSERPSPQPQTPGALHCHAVEQPTRQRARIARARRREDIAPLAHHFLRQHTQRYRKAVAGFEPAAMRALTEHGWPGNVRELDHAIERAVLMAQADTLRATDLALRAPGDGPRAMDDMSLEQVEALLIRKALARHDGNVSRVAEALGLSRSALYRRLQRHGL